MSEAMRPRDRVPYSAIIDRPPLKLPGGAHMAVWTIVNVEEWAIERNMPRTILPPPMGQPLQPDLPNWAWHEYGMRVGFWRFVHVLADPTSWPPPPRIRHAAPTRWLRHAPRRGSRR